LKNGGNVTRCSVGLVAVVVVLAAGLFASAADKPEGGEIHFRTVRLIPLDNGQDAHALHTED